MNKDIGLILCNTERSLEYLKKLIQNKIYIKIIVYLDDKNEDLISKNIKKKLRIIKSKKIKIFFTKSLTQSVQKYLLNLEDKIFIYSGYPGQIIKNKKLLEKKILLHSHPAKLPDYKGSTCIYYSLLREKSIHCSTIIMNKLIDSGTIIFKEKYQIPKNIFSIENIFDNQIRALNLIKAIELIKKEKFKKKNNRFSAINNYKNTYYVAHPVIRQIVFKKFQNF